MASKSGSKIEKIKLKAQKKAKEREGKIKGREYDPTVAPF